LAVSVVVVGAGLSLVLVVVVVVVVVVDDDVFVGVFVQAAAQITNTRKAAIFQFIFLSPDLNFRNKKAERFLRKRMKKNCFRLFTQQVIQ
jgi:hypothetical protein